MNVHDKIILRSDSVWDIQSLAQTALDDSNHFIEEKGGKPAMCIRELPDRIATLPGGRNSTINGRAFDCGTFSLEADQTTALTVPHALGVAPAAVFLYVVDSPFADDGTQLRYQIGKYRVHSDSSSLSISINAANGGANGQAGATNNRFRTEWTASTITFNCDATYPLRAGLTYEWIALGGIA